MLHAVRLWTAVVAGLMIAAAGSPAALEPVAFQTLLAEAELVLEPRPDLEEIETPATSLYRFQKAFRHTQSALEIRYAVRPLGRMEIDYNDPHSSAPNPDHVFPMVFQAMIGRFASHGHAPSQVYPKDKAKSLFNADWAAASLFDADPELATPYASGLLLAMHKNGTGDAYALFLFDDARASKPVIDETLTVLRFDPAR